MSTNLRSGMLSAIQNGKVKEMSNQEQLDRIEAKIDQLNHVMVALLEVLDEGEEFEDGERDQTQPL